MARYKIFELFNTTRNVNVKENIIKYFTELKDDRLKELIQHFTITAHKEEAASLGSFGVEDGIESGEITFF